MRCYAKIEDEGAKLVSVGMGTNTSFYESIGMEVMEIEQSDVDGAWYVFGFAPMKSEKDKTYEKVEKRIKECQYYLDSTDWYTVRFSETGVAIPEEVRTRRQAAREEIDELRASFA